MVRIRVAALFIFVALAAHWCAAQEPVTKKEFIVRNRPGDTRLSKVTIALSQADIKQLSTAAGTAEIPDTLVFIVARHSDKSLAAAFCFAAFAGWRHRESHDIAVALDATATVRDVALTAAETEWPQRILRSDFLKQFAGKSGRDASVDALSGATESSEAISKGVRCIAEVLQRHIIDKEPVREEDR